MEKQIADLCSAVTADSAASLKQSRGDPERRELQAAQMVEGHAKFLSALHRPDDQNREGILTVLVFDVPID